MTLATRIIPTLLTRGRQLVKGVAFDSWRAVGVTAQACRIHSMRGVDELVLLDISATRENRGPDLALIEELSDSMFMPLTVGGGIKTVADVKALLRAGADKIIICSAVCERKEVIRDLAEAVGSQAIVVAIDYRRTNDGRFCVMGAGGTRPCVAWTNDGVPQPIHPAMWAHDIEILGAGEILLTCIDREGKMSGYDLPMINAVAEAISIPVIAHAGAGTYEHMYEAVRAGASAVAAGSMFQFTDATPIEAARYLMSKGVETRA